jgi:hypothetical protein
MRISNGYLIFVLVFIILFAQTNNISANTENWDFQYRGVRAMGMGNAFGAVSDDGDAFYYNPSGLTSIRKFRLDLQPVRVIPTEVFYNETKDINDVLDDIDRIGDSSNPLGDPSLSDERQRLMNKLQRLIDGQLGLDIAVPIRVMLPLHIGDYGVTVGAMAHEWVGAQIDVRKRGLDWGNFVIDMLDDEIFYKIISERVYGISSAICFPIQPSLTLSLGLNAKRIERDILTNENNPMYFADLINTRGQDDIKGTADDFENRFFDPNDPISSMLFGSGFCVDSGVMTSMLDDVIKVGVSCRNLLGKIEYDDVEDETLKRLFNASMAVNVAKIPKPNIPMIDLIVSGDYTGIGSDNPRPRVGVELIWKPLSLISISGRVGNNNGFLTLGAGIQLFFLDMDYAFYGDEITNWHAVSLNLSF